MTVYPLLIAGQPVRTETSDAVVDPATGKLIGFAARAREAEVDAAVDAAASAFPAWAADEAGRRTVLAAAAARLRAHETEIAELLTREQGKPLRQAAAEVTHSAGILDAMARLERPPETVAGDAGRSVQVVERPYGVVAAITPWNVPLLLLFHKIAPALRAGNSVVVKPSEHTPLSTLRVAELLADVFPPGVLNVIAGGGITGALLASHPGIANVSFTGSVATGRKIATAAAANFIPVTLELGGNDPAIILADAPIADIAEALFWAAFANSGQICFAIKRLYVHESRHDELVRHLADRIERTVIGNGLDPATELGPITVGAQRDRVEQLVAEAVRGGAQQIGGGRALAEGNFLRPALITHVEPAARLVVEEQFGPALPILSFSKVEDAIAAANDTAFGLGASVWTSNAAAGAEVARQLDAGLVWTNSHMEIAPGTPKGGWKQSGVGYEGGRWGYERFVRAQTALVRPAPSAN